MMKCPNCGSKYVIKGLGIKVSTPRILRPLRARIGMTCVNCGYQSISKKNWVSRP